jgi:hypothetical protein
MDFAQSEQYESNFNNNDNKNKEKGAEIFPYFIS